MILFTGRGGGICLSACWDTTLLPGKADPPWQGDPSGKETPPGNTDPPCAVHAGRYGEQAGGMHPTGMYFLFWLNFSRSCIKSIARMRFYILTKLRTFGYFRMMSKITTAV